MVEARRKPSEILQEMKKEQQVYGSYRDTATGRMCFSGFIMKEWGLFNDADGVEIYEYRDILDKMLFKNGHNMIGIEVDKQIIDYNDNLEFESGRQTAIEYLRSLEL